MPCIDGREGTGLVYVESGSQTSRLCGIFTVLERNGILNKILEQVDWKEVGVSRVSTERWWKRHKEDDVARRKRENQQKLLKQKKQEALNRISPEDRKLLGL